MKGKKYKRSSHLMQNLFGQLFSFHPPYQVLVDAEFCRAILRAKLVPSEILQVVLGGAVKLLISRCSMHELALDQHADVDDPVRSGAIFVGKRMELRNCRHNEHHAKSSQECIKELISADNPHHYVVAAQQFELRSALRKVPGVPLIFVNRGVCLMEPTSKATQVKVQEIERAKLGLSEHEKLILEKIVPVEAKPRRPLCKRRSKNPNPLSCKKAKTKMTPKRGKDKPVEAAKTATDEKLIAPPTTGKKNRRRKHKPLTIAPSSPDQ